MYAVKTRGTVFLFHESKTSEVNTLKLSNNTS